MWEARWQHCYTARSLYLALGVGCCAEEHIDGDDQQQQPTRYPERWHACAGRRARHLALLAVKDKKREKEEQEQERGGGGGMRRSRRRGGHLCCHVH